MITPKHTPTPWEHGTSQWLATKWIDAGAHPLFLSDLKEVTNNAHESLVAALREFVRIIENHGDQPCCEETERAWEQARAALKLAGEG